MTTNTMPTTPNAPKCAANSNARFTSARRSPINLLLVLLLAAAPSALTAQTPANAQQWADSARRAIDAATLAGDIQSVLATRALIDRVLTRYPGDGWLLHYRAFALFRQATLSQAADPKASIQPLLEESEENLKQSLKALDIPETHALIGSVVGMQITGPIKGMTHGPRANAAMDRAIEKGPNNPRVSLMDGISKIYKPSLFGGGLERAEAAFRKSIKQFEQDRPAALAPAWGREEAWIWLGQVLEKQKRWDDARAAYAKALEIEPRNGWVSHELLPNFEKRKAAAQK